MRHTNALPSPAIFRRWSAIAAVGAAAERRCWTTLRGMPPLYPNTYILLVAAPGIGKSVAINSSSYFAKCAGLKIAAATMTKAAMVDTLKDSLRRIKVSPTETIEYHSIYIPSPEFGNLVPAYDLAPMNFLNDLFDCRDDFIERTRGKGEIKIKNPQVSILAGTQPDYLQAMLPETAWGMGFTSRMILVYSNDKASSTCSLFSYKKPSKEEHEALAATIKKIASVTGEFRWHPEAAKALDEWHLAGGPPVPIAPRLTHYVTRRTIHIVKLMMISSLARGPSLVLEAEDFDTALSWLVEAEAAMPEIFRAMISGGDAAIQTDVAQWIHEQELKTGAFVPKHRIINFIRSRVKAGDVLRLFEVMESAQLLRQAGYDARAQPTYTAAPTVETPPEPHKRARKPQGDLFEVPPPPPLDGEAIVPARYIMRVPTETDEEEQYDEDYYSSHA